VDSLQERIKLLESQLGRPRSGLETATSRHGQLQLDGGRRSSDQDRDHSAAAALSALARVSTPTASATNSAYRSPKANATPLPILSPPEPNENETYEWDEGGDEKELGTDAMGAASTRDYKPGFFGTYLSPKMC
jgi:hypothetical protein